MNRVELEIPASNFQIEEAYKTLRTNIQFCGDDKKVIAVTSCTPDEGKSTVCTQLAMSFAQSGKKTVLIDADIRKSVFMGMTNTNGNQIVGLTHYLSGQATAQDILYSTNIDKMFIAFSGPFPPNPSELLGTDRFKKLITSMRQAADYIIVDTPPLGSVIDSAIIARSCDGAILVIEQDLIGYKFAQEVLDQLKKSECPVLGAVLNKVDIHNVGYYGKRYYGKYGKYGKYGHYKKGYGYGYGYGYGEENKPKQ